MTPARRAELRALCEKATPGPWRWQGEDYRGGWGWQMLVAKDGSGIIVGQDGDGPCLSLRAYNPVDPGLCVTGILSNNNAHVQPVHVLQRDAAFIAAARSAIPELLDALDKATADYERGVRLLQVAIAQEERARIVAWLSGRLSHFDIAKRIERGEHLPKDETKP